MRICEFPVDAVWLVTLKRAECFRDSIRSRVLKSRLRVLAVGRFAIVTRAREAHLRALSPLFLRTRRYCSSA
eukprot:1985475-Pyramimonas_sp.AAC.1